GPTSRATSKASPLGSDAAAVTEHPVRARTTTAAAAAATSRRIGRVLDLGACGLTARSTSAPGGERSGHCRPAQCRSEISALEPRGEEARVEAVPRTRRIDDVENQPRRAKHAVTGCGQSTGCAVFDDDGRT